MLALADYKIGEYSLALLIVKKVSWLVRNTFPQKYEYRTANIPMYYVK